MTAHTKLFYTSSATPKYPKYLELTCKHHVVIKLLTAFNGCTRQICSKTSLEYTKLKYELRLGDGRKSATPNHTTRHITTRKHGKGFFRRC